MKTKYTRKPESLQVVAERSLAAPRNKVWEYWTTAELLDKWWGPEPYKTVTKSFDFSEGGRWHYSMRGPEGDVHWCMVIYHSITPEENFTATDAFCDEGGNTNTELPTNEWDTTFRDENGTTKVTVVITFKSEADMQKLVEMGFEQGFDIGLSQLEKLLEG
jgi:uncharacterized protein YndB with AHSA1/START domain